MPLCLFFPLSTKQVKYNENPNIIRLDLVID